MKEVKTEIEIAATAEQVYDEIVDFKSYPDWNPFIKTATGDPSVGSKLKLLIQPPGGSAMTFSPEVLKAERGKEFRWLGKFLVKGLVDGEHYFLLEQTPEGKTKLTHGEVFKGLLVSVAIKVPMITKGFQAMNEAIKSRLEK